MPPRTAERLAPHDIDAERSMLGAMLLSLEAVATGIEMLEPGDFYHPQHQQIYATMASRRKTGETIDPVSIAGELRVAEPDVEWLPLMLELQNACPSISSAPGYASVIAETAGLRRLIMLSADMSERAFRRDGIDEILEAMKGRLTEVALKAQDDSVFDRLTTFEQFVRDAAAHPVEAVIPNLIGRRERLLIVAPEGAGKGVLMRQLAIAVGGGVHPFTQRPIPALPTLYLDLENPAGVIAHQAELSLRGGRNLMQSGSDSWILSYEEGLNLRTPKAQVLLERAMQVVKPAMLCIGPIYKAARKRGNENWEDATLDLFVVLDELRVRYDCCLIMEHHAPKGAGIRDLVPFGSSAWLRWPEYGVKLEPEGIDRQGRPTKLKVGTFRGNRIDVDWPDELVLGGSNNLPWCGQHRPR